MPFPYQNHYNPNQPRIAKGNPHGGEWTTDGSEHDAIVEAVFYDPNRNPRRNKVRTIIELGELAYRWLSLFNGTRQTIASFKTGEYRRSKLSDEILEYVRQVDDQELKRNCPRFDIVQLLTNISTIDARAAEEESGKKKSPSQFGTDVHARLKRKILRWGDPNFKAEKSYLKTDEAAENEQTEGVEYGTPGSLRIDVLEDLTNGTICVYDIKTGKSKYSGLGPRRRADIQDVIFRAFKKKAQRVILTEIRPQNDDSGSD
jgi:hypothetical protein